MHVLRLTRELQLKAELALKHNIIARTNQQC